MTNDKIEKMKELQELQDKLIERSRIESNTVTSMYLVEAAKAIGVMLEDYRKAFEFEKEVFSEIEKIMFDGEIGGKYATKVIAPGKYAELKRNTRRN